MAVNSKTLRDDMNKGIDNSNRLDAGAMLPTSFKLAPNVKKALQHMSVKTGMKQQAIVNAALITWIKSNGGSEYLD